MEHDEESPDETAPLPVHDLSEAELHDVTVVTTAGNEFEAIALIEALEESGIPAMKRVRHHSSQQPRALRSVGAEKAIRGGSRGDSKVSRRGF